MALRFSDDVKKKLAEKHGVSEDEVRQCFENLEGEYVMEKRPEHLTDPPSHWFVAETNKRRLLKVVFIARKIKTESGSETRVDIKTAFPPDTADIELYKRLGM
jgi:uncharacterized DUF497 family protein